MQISNFDSILILYWIAIFVNTAPAPLEPMRVRYFTNKQLGDREVNIYSGLHSPQPVLYQETVTDLYDIIGLLSSLYFSHKSHQM